MKSKTEEVKNHLIRNGKITSWEAITRYRATRLSAIVYNLRRSGMDIQSTMINEKGVRYALYTYNG